MLQKWFPGRHRIRCGKLFTQCNFWRRLLLQLFSLAHFYKMNKSNELTKFCKSGCRHRTQRNAIFDSERLLLLLFLLLLSLLANYSATSTGTQRPLANNMFTALDFADSLNEVDSDLIIQHDTNTNIDEISIFNTAHYYSVGL